MAEPLLFLSHAGIDTDAARALKRRIEAAPEARAHGLRVWFDKDDLKPGRHWQDQLEQVIKQSTAFAVYLGSRGVVNWVEAEVRLGLSRATGDRSYRFIPIIAAGSAGSAALPGFAAQYHGVRDLEHSPEEFAKFLGAVLGLGHEGELRLEPAPFFGLLAIDETRSHLFFGREGETEELVRLLRTEGLIMVTGDSGSGKSSLARAGLVPAWRGGALALLKGERPGAIIWHVVQAQPRGLPFAGLGDAVGEAARKLGLLDARCDQLAAEVSSRDVARVRRALRCDLPAETTRVLLLVDQFEELVTLARDEDRAPFAELLLALADPADERVRVALTMRRDYYNLLSTFPALFQRLEANGRRARHLVGRMTDEGLRRAVTEPLRLGGVPEGDRAALATTVLRDVGERPGDLALVQMALTETWDRRHQHGDDLLQAYAAVGGVEGAIAKAAEDVYGNVLDEAGRALAEPVFMRLVRLGDTAGATRRVAHCNEFDEARWALIQKLSSTEGKRLLLTGGEEGAETAELAHEALITQWPRYQTWLQAAADDKRRLDRLIERARQWGQKKRPAEEEQLARGTDLDEDLLLLQQRPSWLSELELAYVDASKAAREARREADRQQLETAQALAETRQRQLETAQELAQIRQRELDSAKTLAKTRQQQLETAQELATEQKAKVWRTRIGAIVALVLFLIAAGLGVWGWNSAGEALIERDKATKAAATAAENETRALANEKEAKHQREIALEREHEAARIASVAAENETRALTSLSDVAAGKGRYLDAVKLALAAWPRSSTDKRPRLALTLDALSNSQKNQRQLIPAMRHEASVVGAAFSRDDSRILSWSEDKTVRLWDAATGRELTPAMRHEDPVVGAAFSHDNSRILSWSEDKIVRLWGAATGRELIPAMQHEGVVEGAAFSRDERRILSWSEDKTVRLWNSATGRELIPAMQHEGRVVGAAFGRDDNRILSWSWDKTVRLWDAASGRELIPPMRHEDSVRGAAFSRDESHILSWSRDNTVRLWNSASGRELIPAMRHKKSVVGAVFSRDERRILSWSWDQTVRLWDAATGRELIPAMQHEGVVEGAAFSRDERRILSWSEDNTVRLWDAITGHELVPAMWHEGNIEGAAFNRDERRILSWSWDNTVRLGDAATGRELTPAMRHEGPVFGAAFSRDERRILSWSEDKTVQLWDAAIGRELIPLMRHEDPVRGAAFSRDERRILSWSGDNTVRLWNSATGRELIPAMQHEGVVEGAAFSRDERRILSWSSDIARSPGTVRLWDAATGRELIPAMRHESYVQGAAFSRDERRILSWSGNIVGQSGAVRLWDAATGHELIPAMRHEGRVEGAAFSRDESHILSWSRDKTVRLWDAATGLELIPAMRHESSVLGAAFSRDDSRILSWSGNMFGSSGAVRLWDAASGSELIPAMRHEASVVGAAFSRDESRILSWSDDNTVRLWDAAAGHELVPAMKHEGRVWGATFSRDESRILSWSGDKTVRLWDAATGRELIPAMWHKESVVGAVFSRDERRILSWSWDQTVRLWDAASGRELIAMRHEGIVWGAMFSRDERRILSWSEDNIVRLWDISRVPGGTLLEVACKLLPSKDVSEIDGTYGIRIADPICQSGMPPPDPVALR